MNDTLNQLSQLLKERKESGDADSSYVAQLHHKGLNKILEKMGEECTETLLAAKDAQVSGDKEQLIYETADLWFHSMVMLSHLDTDIHAVLNELARRLGLSGIEEKASRASTGSATGFSHSATEPDRSTTESGHSATELGRSTTEPGH